MSAWHVVAIVAAAVVVVAFAGAAFTLERIVRRHRRQNVRYAAAARREWWPERCSFRWVETAAPDAARGACVLPKGHTGQHRDADGGLHR